MLLPLPILSPLHSQRGVFLSLRLYTINSTHHIAAITNGFPEEIIKSTIVNPFIFRMSLVEENYLCDI
jgi:hypothetical protein